MTQPAPESPPQALLTLSMKGGVGKTITAIGLAKALHRRGHKVAFCEIRLVGMPDDDRKATWFCGTAGSRKAAGDSERSLP